MRTSYMNWLAATFLGVVAVLYLAPVAEAYIPGPAGVGGVARRHVRRAVVVTSAASASQASSAAAANQAAAQSAAAANQAAQAANQAAQAATAAAHSAPALASLPAGCTPAGATYNCSGIYYKPYFQGSTVVYQPVPGP